MGKIPSTNASALTPSEIDISYIKLLKPYTHPNDQFISDDYKDTYGFKDCAEHIEALTPYWLAAKNCNARIVLKKMFTGRVVYDVFYSYDSHALRSIPSTNPKADRFLLFLGCSYTMGEGVNGEDIFVNRLSEKLKPINAFNLGMTAYGPHKTNQVLRK